MRRFGLFFSVSLTLLSNSLAQTNPSSPSIWTEQERQKGARDALRELDAMAVHDIYSLRDVRTLCMNGLAPELHKRQLARGNGFPEAHAYCRAAEDAAVRHGVWRDLFASLALFDLHGIQSAYSAQDWERVSKGEPGKMLMAIMRAAIAGEPNFTGISGKTYPYRPELAYAAGVSYGRINPGEVSPIPNAAEYEAAAQACFGASPATTITVNGEAMPSRRACVLIGAVAGKRLAQNPSSVRG